MFIENVKDRALSILEANDSDKKESILVILKLLSVVQDILNIDSLKGVFDNAKSSFDSKVMREIFCEQSNTSESNSSTRSQPETKSSTVEEREVSQDPVKSRIIITQQLFQGGRIFYGPNGPQIQELIKLANKTFDELGVSSYGCMFIILIIMTRHSGVRGNAFQIA